MKISTISGDIEAAGFWVRHFIFCHICRHFRQGPGSEMICFAKFGDILGAGLWVWQFLCHIRRHSAGMVWGLDMAKKSGRVVGQAIFFAISEHILDCRVLGKGFFLPYSEKFHGLGSGDI